MARSIRFAPLPDPRRAELSEDFKTEDTSSSSSSNSESLETVSTSTYSLSAQGSTTPTQAAWGPGLQRWTSTGSNSSSIRSLTSTGLPIRRTMSTQSATNGKNKGLFTKLFSKKEPKPRRASTASSDTPGLIATIQSSSSRKGTRMLNGRIYGGRRQQMSPTSNSNPFANARDEADPEFVEWGYGGMGSVRSAGVGGRVWDKLMTDASSYGGSGQASATTAVQRSPDMPASDELDDGSGMGWVRRRREQRERERLEKQAKEREEQEKENPQNEATTSDQAGPTADKDQPPPPPLSLLSPQSLLSPASTVTSLGPTSPVSTPGATSPGPLTDEEHHTTAVTVPAPKRHHHGHHHHHQHRHSHSDENATAQTNRSDEPKSPLKDPSETADFLSSSASSTASSPTTTTTDFSESDTEESDSDETQDDSDEDDEDDDEVSVAKRKTSLGAGVEKISRHKT